MIKIFMVGFSTDKGGVESYIANLCSCLDNREYEVIYCWPEMEIDGRKWICPKNRHHYIKYHQFWRSFFRVNHFDVLYYNTCDIVSIDMLRFAKKAGISVRIIHSHSTGIQQRMNRIHWCTEKWNRKILHKYATHLFACSQLAGQWMFGDRCFEIIKNGIDLSKYRYCENYRNKYRQELGLKDEFVIGCVGRLSKEKNLLLAVDVLEKIQERRKDVALVLAGEGDMKESLQMAVRDKGVEQAVYFLGSRDNIHELMSAIDCLMMPSLFEGLPFVLVEAQAAGLSCVVSKNVSKEADLTGLVDFVGLDEALSVWEEKLLQAENRVRKDTTECITQQGYSMVNTAEKVAAIIHTAKIN